MPTPAQILADAFRDDPWVAYIEPDAARRAQWLPWFMDASARLTRQVGVLDREGDGVGLWFGPGVRPFSWWNLARSGLLAAPLRLGREAYVRLERAERDLDRAQAGRVPEGAWYLYMLAVHPDAQGTGLARRLLERGLTRADAARLPVRLETNRPRNLTLYERFGFETVAELDTPGVLPQWVMVRPAR